MSDHILTDEKLTEFGKTISEKVNASPLLSEGKFIINFDPTLSTVGRYPWWVARGAQGKTFTSLDEAYCEVGRIVVRDKKRPRDVTEMVSRLFPGFA